MLQTKFWWALQVCLFLFVGQVLNAQSPKAGVVYTIEATKKGKRVLALKSNKTSRGSSATLVRKSSAESKAMRWKLSKAPGSGYFYLENEASGLVLAPYSLSTGSSWVLKRKSSSNRVKFIPQKGGGYHIQFRTSRTLFLGLDKTKRLKNLPEKDAVFWKFKREAVQNTSSQVGNAGISNTNLGGGIVSTTNTEPIANLAKLDRGELTRIARGMYRIKSDDGLYLVSSEIDMNKKQDGRRLLTKRLNEQGRNGYAYEWKPQLNGEAISFGTTAEGQFDVFMTEDRSMATFRFGKSGLNKPGNEQRFELYKARNGKYLIVLKKKNGKTLLLTKKPDGQARFEKSTGTTVQHWQLEPVLKRDFHIKLVSFKILEENDPGNELEIRKAELNVFPKGTGTYPGKLLVYKQPASNIDYEKGETYRLASQGLKIIQKRFEERNRKSRVELELHYTFKEEDRLKMITRGGKPEYATQDFVGKTLLYLKPVDWTIPSGRDYDYTKKVVVRDGGNVLELLLEIREKAVYPVSEPVKWRTYRDYNKVN